MVPDRPRPDPPDGDAPLNPPLAGRFRRTAGIPGRVAPSDSPAPFPSSPSSSASSSAPPSSGLTSAPSPVPAVVVAGTHSGAGKTTITAVLARELRRRGLTVQPFKIGPDFIDPGYHGEAAGRRSINLDLWMMGEEGVRRSFARWSRGADIAVIEAMGAVFDGADGTGEGSAAHLAGILGVPLLVVVDVWGMTRTTGAILQGLLGFDPDTTIVGCILNRVGSAKHAQMIRDSLPPELERLVLGAVPYRRALEIPERHLGLLTREENEVPRADRAAAQADAAGTLDVDRILDVLGVTATAPRTDVQERPARSTPTRVRVAVARDHAFCFYYEGNLLALRDAGCEIVPFSPIADRRLPPGTDAVYVGGGYPESFADALEANTDLGAEMAGRVEAGMPVYAECGGLMWLARSLTGFDGRRHRMLGLLPLDVAMDRDFLAIRYVEVRTRADSPLGPAGTVVRGQEFHQSRIVASDVEPSLYDVTTSDGETFRAGFLRTNVAAGYIHLYFADHRRLVENFVRTAIAARSSAE